MIKIKDMLKDNKLFAQNTDREMITFLNHLEEFFGIEILWDENSLSANYPYVWKIGEEEGRGWYTSYEYAVIKALDYMINGNH